MINVRHGYCFDDLLLQPKYSNVTTRKDVDLSVDLGKGVKLTAPIISANMKNVTEAMLACDIGSMGGLGLLPRFCSIAEQVGMFLDCGQQVGASVGVKEQDKERVDALVRSGCHIICVDVAHGHHVNCSGMVNYIAVKHPDVLIIAGNVATRKAAEYLAHTGADVIKVGIGPGSLCTTRIETGTGVPQMTALSDVYYDANTKPGRGGARKFKIIADGGIRRAGDIVKALCFSDAVMLGSMLAGTDESPGTVETVKGTACKAYEGSSTHKTSGRNVEGVKAYVTLKGPIEPIISRLLDGIRSGCSYQGVNNLTELKYEPIFVEISNAGLAESHPHSVMVKE